MFRRTEPRDGRDDASATRNVKREQILSPVNARGLLICKIRYATAPPLSLPSPGRFLPDLDRRRKPRGPFFKWVAGLGMLGNSDRKRELVDKTEPKHISQNE